MVRRRQAEGGTPTSFSKARLKAASDYDVSGAGAVRRDGVLQRLLRDASCLTHHISACPTSFELTGRVRSGIDKLSFRI